MTDESAPTPPYQVLARKYRPGTFSELIGQHAMVRTLRNAIEQDRLAHAFILTGVRGVGKTTTARLIARALNCIGADGTGGPTVDPCGQCEHCLAIAESRHVDVLEMDAASRTGVDDVREIIEGVRYAPGSARFKVYIIDEVHMLSRNAFNALLKTLEEPPEHVKFVFATTEIRKVPVTVLSRCQRFDLRRIETAVLAEYFATLAEREGATIEPEALALIARAADGSVRDGLSLLDQAIAHGSGQTDAAQVRAMLGLADRLLVMDLFSALMQGDIASALANLTDQYNAGADPVTVLQDLLELTHWVTQIKVAPGAREDLTVPEAERQFGSDMAAKLPMPHLTRTWQMLLKGLEETRRAPVPLSAAEMAIIRLAYAADLPSPAELIKQVRTGKASGQAQPPSAQPVTAQPAPAQPAPAPSGGAQSERVQSERVQSERVQSEAAPSERAQFEATPTEAMSGGGDAPDLPRANGPAAVAEPHREPASEDKAGGQLVLNRFEDVIALCRTYRELRLEGDLMERVHLVAFKAGHIEIRPTTRAQPNLANLLGQKLSEWTGERWVVSVSGEQGAPTMRDQHLDRQHRLQQEVSRHPLVKAALETFPGAKISGVIEKDDTGLDTEPMVDPDQPDEENE